MKSTFRAIRAGLARSKWWFQRPLMLASAKPKVRYIAGLDEVTVTRDGDCARIEYKEAGIAITNLEIGPGIAEMTDRDIVEVHNQGLRNDTKQATEYKHVVFEVPLGSAQIEYFARCDQWVPRSCVLRCLIQVAEHGEIIVKIDGRKLRLKQFGKLLAAYGGCGMRIEFVPADEVHRRPVLQVREPR
jgi:hypothetical protein